MNQITDKSVSEFCNYLCPIELFSETDLTVLRENVYKSHYGVFNIPREQQSIPVQQNVKNPVAHTPIPTEPAPLLLPPLPINLQYVESKKVAQPAINKKGPQKPPTVVATPTTPTAPPVHTVPGLDWDLRSERYAVPEVAETLPAQSGSRSASRNGPTPPVGKTTKKGKQEPVKPKDEVIPPPVVEEEIKPVVPAVPQPLFKVPGNNCLKSLNLSLNRGITNECVKSILDMLQHNTTINKLSLTRTRITEQMFIEIVNKLSETRNAST
ncbi:hypothetical protein AKO1_004124 [Acrasis kona]|uniref:Uncharacterized protein n=1 Tax=Acrasis kona TaxID=1008807 RepID=A0AAW2Z941_9EUKA